ncbi:putative T7SS-secreted protein [Streptomyces sp. NPDC048256]|uniref:putative T7SS-secreted protein n=1 Tax=unclassified Streptomyces TaxID=2593676 RepID=UPI0033CD7BE9
MNPQTPQTYDALGFDPAPGMPASVHQLVASLSSARKQLHDAQTTLSRLGRTDGEWVGEAASAFARKTGVLPRYLADGHDSLTDAEHALRTWESQLADFQALARRYEHEAATARQELGEARNNPDLKLAGQTFDTDEELQSAQRRLDRATQRVNEASEDLDVIIGRARELLHQHQAAARVAAGLIREAAEDAPVESLLDMLADALKGLGDRIKDLAGDLWDWIKKHSDTIYEIGDWLGYASAACDVLAVIFSETIIGAVVFEGIGMVLNGGALLFHGVGWAAGAKKGNWADIGLDLVGFVPFGDLLRLGKVGKGAFKGVKIPMNVLDFGAKAADAWKRADDIIEHVGGTAKLGDDAEQWVMRNVSALGSKAHAIHVTADTLADRFKVAVAKEFGDYNLYRPGAGITDFAFQKAMPRLIESTPLGRIPALADSVRPIVDDAGETVGKYIDPRSWTARGYEGVLGAKNLYKEGVRIATDPVQYGSEKFHETIDQARETTGDVLGRLADANPFG